MGTIQRSISPAYHHDSISPWKKFITWADKQEDNRFLWLAIGIAGHGFVFTIVTIMMVIFTGNNFIYWPFVIGAMALSLVTNLAALPTKITIPVFFATLLIDIVIIALCLAHGFDLAATYV